MAALNATGNDEEIELDLPKGFMYLKPLDPPTDSPSDRLARLHSSLDANSSSLSPPPAICAENAAQVQSSARLSDSLEDKPHLDSTTL